MTNANDRRLAILRRAAKLDERRQQQIANQRRIITAMMDYLTERDLVDAYNDWYEENRSKYEQPAQSGD